MKPQTTSSVRTAGVILSVVLGVERGAEALTLEAGWAVGAPPLMEIAGALQATNALTLGPCKVRAAYDGRWLYLDIRVTLAGPPVTPASRSQDLTLTAGDYLALGFRAGEGESLVRGLAVDAEGHAVAWDHPHGEPGALHLTGRATRTLVTSTPMGVHARLTVALSALGGRPRDSWVWTCQWVQGGKTAPPEWHALTWRHDRPPVLTPEEYQSLKGQRERGVLRYRDPEGRLVTGSRIAKSREGGGTEEWVFREGEIVKVYYYAPGGVKFKEYVEVRHGTLFTSWLWFPRGPVAKREVRWGDERFREWDVEGNLLAERRVEEDGERWYGPDGEPLNGTRFEPESFSRSLVARVTEVEYREGRAVRRTTYQPLEPHEDGHRWVEKLRLRLRKDTRPLPEGR